MAQTAPQHGNLPTRSATNQGGYVSDDDAVPAADPTNTTELLTERLQAWKHMCGYLENYVSEVAKDQKSQAKDQEKILKTLSHPLKEGHHFDQNLGGIAGLFENLRANTQSQSNMHQETSKSLTGSILPILERLHSEIKSKSKEISHGAGKGSKAVESARNASQKHIELLGQHAASFDSTGSKPNANLDPYVIQKQVYHRLNKQIMEENSNRQDLIAVQNSFQQFEANIIQTVQTVMNNYNQVMSNQADRQKMMYGDIAGNASRISKDFEWQGFVNRNSNTLIPPNAPPRTMDSISFPNQDHRATKALIEGSLERKGRGLGSLSGYSTGYYAVTPAGYLHEFKDNDNYRHDPTPEHSLYLRDSVIGAVDGVKFAIKGKDTSGSKLAQKMSTSSEYTFKAHSPQDAAEWHRVISMATHGTSSSLPTSPTSPQDQKQQIPPLQTGAVGAAGAQQYGTHQTPTSATTGSGVVPQEHHGMQQTPTSATGGLPPQYVQHQQPGMGQPGVSQQTPTSATGAVQPQQIPQQQQQTGLAAAHAAQYEGNPNVQATQPMQGGGMGSVPQSAISGGGPNPHFYSQPGQHPMQDPKV